MNGILTNTHSEGGEFMTRLPIRIPRSERQHHLAPRQCEGAQWKCPSPLETHGALRLAPCQVLGVLIYECHHKHHKHWGFWTFKIPDVCQGCQDDLALCVVQGCFGDWPDFNTFALISALLREDSQFGLEFISKFDVVVVVSVEAAFASRAEASWLKARGDLGSWVQRWVSQRTRSLLCGSIAMVYPHSWWVSLWSVGEDRKSVV